MRHGAGRDIGPRAQRPHLGDDVLLTLVITACALLSSADSCAAISEWTVKLGPARRDLVGLGGPRRSESALCDSLQAVDAPALGARWPARSSSGCGVRPVVADHDGLLPIAESGQGLSLPLIPGGGLLDRRLGGGGASSAGRP